MNHPDDFPTRDELLSYKNGTPELRAALHRWLDEPAPDRLRGFTAHVHAQLPELEGLIQSFRDCYASNQSPAHLIPAIEALGGLAVIRTWSALTAAGVADIPFAKWVHHHFGRTVLDVFGTAYELRTQATGGPIP